MPTHEGGIVRSQTMKIAYQKKLIPGLRKYQKGALSLKRTGMEKMC
ncbi:MAG: hypothetical protein ACE5Z5_08150 [Candidatus Bathyarchaeia archaeon]